jgi:hypothetical protein
VEDLESRRIALMLARQIGDGADAADVAETIVWLWREIDAALRPILGQRGVAALYKRSLHLCSAHRPWLAGLQQGLPTAMDLDALQSAFARQDSAIAAAAGDDLLQTFQDLLTSLVGPSLAERLLQSVWTSPSSGAPAQDISS